MRREDGRQNRSDIFVRPFVERPPQLPDVDDEADPVRLDEVLVLGVDFGQVSSKVRREFVVVEDVAEAARWTRRSVGLERHKQLSRGYGFDSCCNRFFIYWKLP